MGAFTLWTAVPVVLPEPGASAKPPAAQPAAQRRVGVVASRVAVGNAVQRNRAKRRMRELFRKHQDLVPPGHDLLIVARAALNRLEYAEIERKFVDACRKAFPSTRPPDHVA